MGGKYYVQIMECINRGKNYKWIELSHSMNNESPFGTHIDFPGWSLEALKYIYEVRSASANGHETLDTDASAVAEASGDLTCERYVLAKGKLQVELLKNLDKVSEAGAVILVSYPRFEGATGLPARVWAITE